MEGARREQLAWRRHIHFAPDTKESTCDQGSGHTTDQAPARDLRPQLQTRHSAPSLRAEYTYGDDDEEERMYRTNPPNFSGSPHLLRAVQRFDALAKPPPARPAPAIQRIEPLQTCQPPQVRQKRPALPPQRASSDSDDIFVQPSLVSCGESAEEFQLTELQEAVYKQFAGQHLSDHVCMRPVQPIFVGADIDATGTSVAYATYTGPDEAWNSAQLISDTDRWPIHMTRRAPLGPAALRRRAELRGTITALQWLAQAPLQPACAHVCVSSAYVAKAWGSWIPQWNAHGWPGEDSDARLRTMRRGLMVDDNAAMQRSGLPHTPLRQQKHLLSMESPTPKGTDPDGHGAGPSGALRRTNRRLVDEDLLRELAALRTRLAEIDAQGGVRVYLYQIEAQHNPAESLAISCVMIDAPEMEPSLSACQDDVPITPQAYEPMRVVSPPRLRVQDSRQAIPSPVPDDVFLRSPSPHAFQKRSPLLTTPSKLTTPHPHTTPSSPATHSPSMLMCSSPTISASRSNLFPTPPTTQSSLPHVSPLPHMTRSNLLSAASPSSPRKNIPSPTQPWLQRQSPQIHPQQIYLQEPLPSQRPPSSMSPNAHWTQLPSEKPTDVSDEAIRAASPTPSREEALTKPLTAEALREHNRKTGNGRFFRRQARSTRSSVKSDGAQSFIHRWALKFLRKSRSQRNLRTEERHAASPRLGSGAEPSTNLAATGTTDAPTPPTQARAMTTGAPAPAPAPVLGIASSSTAASSPAMGSAPAPRLRTSASQPAMGRRSQQGPKDNGLSTTTPDTPKPRVLVQPPQDNELQRQKDLLAQRDAELARREDALARKEVDMARLRFEWENKRPFITPSKGHSVHVSDDDDDVDEPVPDDNEWLWQSNLNRTPRLTSADLDDETDSFNLQPYQRSMNTEASRLKEATSMPQSDLFASRELATAQDSPQHLTRGSQWVLYEESQNQRLRQRRAPPKIQTPPRQPAEDCLGLYVDGDGFGSSTSLRKSSPYARHVMQKRSQGHYPSSESDDSSFL